MLPPSSFACQHSEFRAKQLASPLFCRFAVPAAHLSGVCTDAAGGLADPVGERGMVTLQDAAALSLAALLSMCTESRASRALAERAFQVRYAILLSYCASV